MLDRPADEPPEVPGRPLVARRGARSPTVPEGTRELIGPRPMRNQRGTIRRSQAITHLRRRGARGSAISLGGRRRTGRMAAHAGRRDLGTPISGETAPADRRSAASAHRTAGRAPKRRGSPAAAFRRISSPPGLSNGSRRIGPAPSRSGSAGRGVSSPARPSIRNFASSAGPSWPPASCAPAPGAMWTISTGTGVVHKPGDPCLGELRLGRKRHHRGPLRADRPLQLRGAARFRRGEAGRNARALLRSAAVAREAREGSLRRAGPPVDPYRNERLVSPDRQRAVTAGSGKRTGSCRCRPLGSSSAS